jgi:transposase
MPAVPAWLTNPLWGQFAALLPERPAVDPTHPLGCHRARTSDRIVFDTMLQVLRFGCSYEAIADTTCSATTIRNRHNEWIELGVFAQLKTIVLDAYDRIVVLILKEISVDGYGIPGKIAHKGNKAPIQAGQRWHVERTNAWHNAFNRLQRCHERTPRAIDAFFDLTDAIITLDRFVTLHGANCVLSINRREITLTRYMPTSRVRPGCP